MMQGKSNKAIGRTLDLAEPTVRNHVTAVLKALNVTNRTEAVIAVVELGLGLAAADVRRADQEIVRLEFAAGALPLAGRGG